MHTELSMEQLYDLFFEVGSSCNFLTGITYEMKEPRILLSITAPSRDGELIEIVTVIDCKNPTNSYLFDLSTKTYMKSGSFELIDIPRD